MANVFVDNTKETSTITGANWQFTNGNPTVQETGALGNALAEVAIGDYIRTNGGTQWYKVAGIPNDDTITLSQTFEQGTNTDTCKLNSEDGTAVGSDYAHHNQAISDSVRSPGDIVKTRANLTYTYAGITLAIDEAGTVNSQIILKGADSVDDPWGDSSDVRPIIDFGSTTSSFGLNKSYLTLDHLDFTGTTNANGAVQISFCNAALVNDCRIYDNGASAVARGLVLSTAIGIKIIDCEFWNNYGYGIRIIGSKAFISGCIFDGDPVGGGNGTDYGLFCNESGTNTAIPTVYLKDCTFGVTDAHDVADIDMTTGSIYCRNVKLASPTEVASGLLPESFVYIEDDEQIHLAFRAWTFTGNLSRTTAVERSGSGGTAWSILGEPNSNCGIDWPLYIIGDWLRGIPIYLDGSSQTITMWAYVDSTGGGWTPNASEFFFELDYHNGAADWQQEVSIDTFAAEDQWESFSVTISADAAGPAYLRAVLKDNVAGGKIYIDPEPVFS